MEFGGQGGSGFGPIRAGFEMRGPNQQSAFGAARLQVDSGDYTFVVEKWQDVVAVFALRLGRVDLDTVMKAKQTLVRGAVEDQRIERR